MPRKQKKYHYIYKTTNLLSGKYYIGMHSTHDLNDGYYGSGTRLRRSLRKYGKKNHLVLILEYLDSRDELKKREEEIVNLNEIAKENCMNLMVGGKGGFISVEQQKRRAIAAGLAAAKRRRNDPILAKKLKKIASNNFKNANATGKIKYDTFKGKHHTQETKDKIGKSNSIQQKGTKNSQYGTYWITNGKENKKIKKNDLIPNKWSLGRTLKKKL